MAIRSTFFYWATATGIFSFLIFMAWLPVLMAQPGLPTAPDQAPIDGGLGILAVAGGAYAIRKLRKTRSGAAKNDKTE